MGLEVPHLPEHALHGHCLICENDLKYRLHKSQLDYIGAFATHGPALSSRLARLLARKLAASVLAPGARIARDASGRPYVVNQPHMALAFCYASHMAFTAMIHMSCGHEAPLLAIDAESPMDDGHLNALFRHFSKLCGYCLISLISPQNLRTLWLLYECGIKIFGHTDGGMIKALIQHTGGHIPGYGSLPYHQSVLHWRLHRINDVLLCVASEAELGESPAVKNDQPEGMAYARVSYSQPLS